MNLRAPQKDQKGFTIIEVMIVLAIAGLIILIVFLAVPALQRNSRNTQRRNDAARVSGFIAEYVSNNNGQLPTAVETNSAQVGNGELLVETSDLSIYTGATLATSGNGASNVDQLVIRTGAACDANALNTSAGTRAYAVTFQVETSSGGGAFQCI